MSGLHFVRGVLRRHQLPQTGHCYVFRRTNFLGRPVPSGPTSLLPSTPARTRFAPSPTGYVHIGSLRTALFNFLLAKATGGQFLLRVEDTDQNRLVPDAEQKLYEDLKWAGLSWDEGPGVGGAYGPYKQSQRLPLYSEHANQLVEEGKAYRCFCTPEELDAVKKLEMDESGKSLYNKKCTHISAEESAQRAANGEKFCIRFKSDGTIPLVQDLVYGTYKSSDPLDDFILMKRDGFPTYHFANIVDDHVMNITHVIRGAEWLVSTPRHVALYNAFGWQAPQFAHVGLLVDGKGQKISKRFGGFHVSSWKEKGTLPIALLNHVLLLGWSPIKDRTDQSDIMDMNDMIQKFHLRFTKGNITVNSKNEFLQKAHMRKSMSEGENKESTVASIMPALLKCIQQCEEGRESQEDQGLPHKDMGVRIGPLLQAARSSEASTPSPVSESYLKTLLDLDGKSYSTPLVYLQRNVYLLWQIPEQEYRERLQDQQAVLDKIFVQTGSGEETKQTAQKVSDLSATFLETLQAITEGDWTEKNVKEILGPLIKSIYYSTDEKPLQAWGWKFLRWVISANAAGPSLIPSMVFLGKEETLARVSQAKEIAQSMGF